MLKDLLWQSGKVEKVILGRKDYFILNCVGTGVVGVVGFIKQFRLKNIEDCI
jgi:hypothetical protein